MINKIIKFKYLLLIISLVLLHLFLLFNLQFTTWPEMFSFPYFYLKGFVIYKDYVHPYPPLLTLLLAGVYKIFGFKILVLKIFTWVLVVIGDVFIFKITKLITLSSAVSSLSLLIYVLIHPFLDGNMLWFDTALVAPILVAAYFGIKYFNKDLDSFKNLFLSGLFLGFALLTKQTAIVFIASIVFLILFTRKRFKNVVILLTPILVMTGILSLGIIKNNSFYDFVNWNFTYPANFWTSFPGYVILTVSKSDQIKLFLILLPSLLFLFIKFKEIFSNKSVLLLYLFLIAGLMSVYPRFSFFHFQTAMAFAVVIFGVFMHKVKLPFYLVLIYFLLIAKIVVFPNLRANWQKETRFLSTSEIKLAQTISSKVGGDSYYLLGQNSIYYVLTGNLPPKPWLDNFGWFFEVPNVQTQAINSWQQSPPQAIFIQEPNPGNWYDIGTYQPKQILSWIETNYTKREMIAPGLWYWQLNTNLKKFK